MKILQFASVCCRDKKVSEMKIILVWETEQKYNGEFTYLRNLSVIRGKIPHQPHDAKNPLIICSLLQETKFCLLQKAAPAYLQPGGQLRTY